MKTLATLTAVIFLLLGNLGIASAQDFGPPYTDRQFGSTTWKLYRLPNGNCLWATPLVDGLRPDETAIKREYPEVSAISATQSYYQTNEFPCPPGVSGTGIETQWARIYNGDGWAELFSQAGPVIAIVGGIIILVALSRQRRPRQTTA